MGSLENEIRNNYELEGEILPEKIVPIRNIPDDGIVQPIHVVKDNVAPKGCPRVETPYRARLKKVLIKYIKCWK